MTDSMAAPLTLDDVYHEVTKFEANSRRKNRIILGLVVALLIASSGWWYTSSDHRIAARNGRVADCRSVEFGRTLDRFEVLVKPSASKAQQHRAARQLAAMEPLETRYAACGRAPYQPLPLPKGS